VQAIVSASEKLVQGPRRSVSAVWAQQLVSAFLYNLSLLASAVCKERKLSLSHLEASGPD
jgi:hypothetical protein